MLPEIQCPTCKSKDAISDGQTMSWLLSYSKVIKDGKLHDHNPNQHKQMFQCSNGHHFFMEWFTPCNLCGWSGGLTKFIAATWMDK